MPSSVGVVSRPGGTETIEEARFLPYFPRIQRSWRGVEPCRSLDTHAKLLIYMTLVAVSMRPATRPIGVTTLYTSISPVSPE